jgi:hypothetical protein
VGTTKVIKNFVIVKPKIDRVPRINPRLPPKEPVTLADQLPGKMFLQKYQGVRSQFLRDMSMDKHADERFKRTEYPRIDPYVPGTDHLEKHDVFGGT